MAAAGHQAREQWEPIWNCPPGSTRRIYLGNQVWDFDSSEQHEQTCVHSSVNQMWEGTLGYSIYFLSLPWCKERLKIVLASRNCWCTDRFYNKNMQKINISKWLVTIPLWVDLFFCHVGNSFLGSLSSCGTWKCMSQIWDGTLPGVLLGLREHVTCWKYEATSRNNPSLRASCVWPVTLHCMRTFLPTGGSKLLGFSRWPELGSWLVGGYLFCPPVAATKLTGPLPTAAQVTQ